MIEIGDGAISVPGPGRYRIANSGSQPMNVYFTVIVTQPDGTKTIESKLLGKVPPGAASTFIVVEGWLDE